MKELESRPVGAPTPSQDLRQRLRDDPTHVLVDGAVTVKLASLPEHITTKIVENPFFQLGSSGAADPTMAFNHLPVLLVSHQPDEGKKLMARIRNAQRICISSAVYFLKAIGIQDFPVYGLATCGFRAYLSQAWYSREDDVSSSYALHFLSKRTLRASASAATYRTGAS